jgi:VIT1/CCC1 family predicted Fe2+/Mn2+ transporter
MTIFSRKTPDYDSISQGKSSDEETVLESESLGLGMTGFLLGFGEGVEEVSTFQMNLSAFTIGFSYFFGGLIPMVNAFLCLFFGKLNG